MTVETDITAGAETLRHRREEPQKLSILFLGNSYNPFSIACLMALLIAGHDIVVGEHNPVSRGPWRVLKETARTRGAGFVIRKASEFLLLQTRLMFRRLGFSFGQFACLAEVIFDRKLKLIPCKNPNTAEFISQARDLNIDLIVVAGFSRILKPPIISVPGLGCVNVHPSLLPRFRGPEPLYWVLAEREKMAGVTIHYIDQGIDSGNIILQREFPISKSDSERTLLLKSNKVAAELLREVLPLLAAGTAPSIPQNESEASYYPLPPKAKFRAIGTSAVVMRALYPLFLFCSLALSLGQS